ncbi:SDR family oxidoreductase [Flavisolibacter nicotianae]|uniref:SDR family oxidoreductase n=1 Tax=Flavisolibacter nicotianae TaxID=2364882 RepID=UPI000EAE5F3C|nr:SDR family oxidoreductase [Flavisolibacter nicotianae]
MKKAENKIVVVTGASSGAGRAIAIELAREGAQLVLASRREEALAEVVDECKEVGGSAVAFVTDVKEMLDVHRLAKETVQQFGAIDVWVNNAGVLAAGAFDNIPAEVNEDVIRTNLFGYMHGAQAVLPVFKQQGYGLLINNISVGGWFYTPYMTAYSASKFGLRGFFESLKGELKQFPAIRICDLYPGFLDTPGMQHAANYTGKTLRPAPPVYDPRKVAKAVVAAIQRPRDRIKIGSASFFLQAVHTFFPLLSRNITASVVRSYFARADESETTSGNVLQPVDFGTGIDGGWQAYFDKGVLRKGVWVAAGLLAVAVILSRKK